MATEKNNDEALVKTRKWMWFYFLTLAATIGYFALYIGYIAVVFKPSQKMILLNQINAVYSDEDLAKTNVSEGEIKQFIVDVIKKTFTYDYLSYVSEEEYQTLLTGEKEVDIPDHRDFIKNLYSGEALEQMLDDLSGAPWMNAFYRDRRYVQSHIFSPPIKEGYKGWTVNDDGRLNIGYTGYFFVISKSHGKRTFRYRIDYHIVAERKPNPIMEHVETYYFYPLVPMNTFEWQIKTFEWEAKRAL
ncbi:hypothetical protein [Alteromonas sp. 14N.309.X.WAT.G.H12]|uniref:hypothetical protein n=1 Tax=Alteromonas sp. 14N.309.X.WAT.G.H12 TaxID=3120824 RepID=UPI002FD1E086